jgi:phosphatidyl-myo-inositol alpha-mannosyltransferase
MDTYKIAFVLDDSLDKTDGVQQYILTLGQYLAEQGHTVHYLVGETKRQDIPNIHSLSKNVAVRFNQNRMSIPLPASKKTIHDLLLREEFDIIHVQMPYSPMLGARVIRAASDLTGVVGTFHIAPHSRLVHLANSLLRLLLSGTIGRFDELISVSRVAQSFAWDTFRINSSVVPNTLRLDSFYDAKPFKKYEAHPTIVFMGRLVERKGCYYLLRAVAALHDQQALPDGCRVLICGTGPLEAELRAYVTSRHLDNIVTFVGYVTEADKPRYLASGTVVVYPSTGGESFGIVLLEGMAATNGVVLAGNNPGYASVMGERPEVLFDPLDETQFATKLHKYLTDPTLRERAYEWQQQFVRKFDVATVAEDLLVVYTQALHKRRS